MLGPPLDAYRLTRADTREAVAHARQTCLAAARAIAKARAAVEDSRMLYAERGHWQQVWNELQGDDPDCGRLTAMTSPTRAAGRNLRQPVTALLVDDEESLRRVLARELTEAGLVVVEAANGEEALLAARDLDGQLDVVITDISMPVMDGLEFARSFRPLFPGVPILFITGTDPRPLDALGNGLEEELLLKPFAPDLFLYAVLRAIKGARHSGRTSA